MRKTIALFVFALLFSNLSLSAQKLDHVLGEFIVQFHAEADIQAWAKAFRTFEGKPTRILLRKQLSRPLNISAVTFDHNTIHEYRFIAAARKHPAVQLIQFNHLVNMRSTVPNDTLFDNQWQYINTGQSGGLAGADLDIDLAWDITTGGLTTDGDTIVVCVLDDGIDTDHEDLVDNLWINHAEIPGNGIDDDNNGYIDDYRGWSTVDDNDAIEGGSHGTPVAGIIGARGNNEVGVSGISWDVKVMVVRNNFNTNEASVIEAYSYPLTQRMRYNQTNGAEGAFVVATNASWGVNFGDPEDAPIWCAFYDTLGVHGIISCGATINGNVNVDVEGDLPTACPSDYLISVTNVNDQDVKVTSAGYGAMTIDLGAFGEDTYTTRRDNIYSGFGGTSGATPHVTGTVGLLYSAPCPSLMALAKSDPGAAALLIKQYILDGVSPNASLDTITVTGGRLNVNKSIRILMENCGDCQPPSSINIANLTDIQATIQWNVNDSINRVDLRYRMAGVTNWTEIMDVNSPFVLPDLLACTNYEFQMQTFCNSDTLPYETISRTFKTDGCCESPFAVFFNDITLNSVAIAWNSVLAATSYTLRIRPEGITDWSDTTVSAPSLILENLDICTSYEVQVRTNCAGMMDDFTESYFFGTSGCGPCIDLDYCIPDNLNADDEWIAGVTIGDLLDNMSGSNGGYGDFTGLLATELEQGGSYPLTLTPGYADNNFGEDFRIWIDFNQDGTFQVEEIVFDIEDATNVPVTSTLTIPPDASLGNTRMRVFMQFLNVGGPCMAQGQAFGEVEDYCLEIRPTSMCESPTRLDTVAVEMNSSTLAWEKVGPAISYDLRYRAVGDPDWVEIQLTDTSIVLQNLEECLEYEAQVRTNCSIVQDVYSGLLTFKTDCILGITDPAGGLGSWQVMPNPFRERLDVDLTFDKKIRQGRLELINSLGQVLAGETPDFNTPGSQRISFSTRDLPAGVYFIRLQTIAGVLAFEKVVKLNH